MNFQKLLSFLALTLLFTGCTGYKLGSMLPEKYQTVCVVVHNESAEPSVEVQIMKAMRAELQFDGRLKIREKDEADTVLEITLVDYYLSALSYDKNHGGLAREYRVSLRAKAVFYDANTEQVLREVPGMTGHTDFPYDADLTSGKRSAMLNAAKDLARKTISMTVAAW